MLNTDNIFELSFEYASCGETITDFDGNFIKANSSFCDTIGYSKTEILKIKNSSITPETSCAIEKEELAKLYRNEEIHVRYQIQRITKAGKRIDLSINAIAIHNDKKDSTPIYVLMQIEKLSTSDELKKEIKEKQFFLDKIMNEMPAHIYFKDLQSRFILTNNSMLKLFGVKNMNEILGKTDFDFFADEHAQKAYRDEKEIMACGKELKQVEKEVWPNGKVTWAHTTKKPLYNDKGELIGTFGISKDITDSKKAEKALEEANEQIGRKNKELQVTLENLKETQSQLVNAEKLAALGQLIAGIAHEINTPLGAINASNSNISSSFDLLINSFESTITQFTDTELLLLKKLLTNYKNNHVTPLASREKRQIKRNIAERLSKEGNANGATIADTIVYINQHDHVESILKFSKEVNLLSVLKVAKNMISLIKNSENINIATTKASQVVLALKKYIHKTQDGNKTQTDIIDNIETVLTLNHNKIKQGVKIIKKYDDIPFISTYPDEISQVWNNLITNAMHAMNNQGTITIEIINKSATVIFKFTDTGCGIPEDIQDKIFTPFFTTKASGEGTGLGLDIVKRIIDKHEGTLTLDSEINRGTTFTIELPKK